MIPIQVEEKTMPNIRHSEKPSSDSNAKIHPHDLMAVREIHSMLTCCMFHLSGVSVAQKCSEEQLTDELDRLEEFSHQIHIDELNSEAQIDLQASKCLERGELNPFAWKRVSILHILMWLYERGLLSSEEQKILVAQIIGSSVQNNPLVKDRILANGSYFDLIEENHRRSIFEVVLNATFAERSDKVKATWLFVISTLISVDYESVKDRILTSEFALLLSNALASGTQRLSGKAATLIQNMLELPTKQRNSVAAWLNENMLADKLAELMKTSCGMHVFAYNPNCFKMMSLLLKLADYKHVAFLKGLRFTIQVNETSLQPNVFLDQCVLVSRGSPEIASEWQPRISKVLNSLSQ